MLIFLVTSFKATDPALQAKISEHYETANLKLGTGNSWLVADSGVTTKEVSDKLGLDTGSDSSAIVVKVDSYFGFGPPNIWEWIKVKSQSS